MLNNMQPLEVGWYDWDCRLAAVVNSHAFVLNPLKGWRKVNAADVRHDGEQFENAEQAIECYSDEWNGIDPSVVAAFIARGLAPPRPRRFRRYLLLESVRVLSGRDDLEGNILVEFDDGWIRKVNGSELANLAERFPSIKQWRLSGRENY